MVKKFLENKYRQWLSILLLMAAGLIAAGKAYHEHTELCDKIELKIDRELYDRDQQHFGEKLQDIKDTVARIEEKLDGIILGKYKTDVADGRNPRSNDQI